MNGLPGPCTVIAVWHEKKPRYVFSTNIGSSRPLKVVKYKHGFPEQAETFITEIRKPLRHCENPIELGTALTDIIHPADPTGY